MLKVDRVSSFKFHQRALVLVTAHRHCGQESLPEEVWHEHLTSSQTSAGVPWRACWWADTQHGTGTVPLKGSRTEGGGKGTVHHLKQSPIHPGHLSKTAPTDGTQHNQEPQPPSEQTVLLVIFWQTVQEPGCRHQKTEGQLLPPGYQTPQLRIDYSLQCTSRQGLCSVSNVQYDWHFHLSPF